MRNHPIIAVMPKSSQPSPRKKASLTSPQTRLSQLNRNLLDLSLIPSMYTPVPSPLKHGLQGTCLNTLGISGLTGKSITLLGVFGRVKKSLTFLGDHGLERTCLSLLGVFGREKKSLTLLGDSGLEGACLTLVGFLGVLGVVSWLFNTGAEATKRNPVGDARATPIMAGPPLCAWTFGVVGVAGCMSVVVGVSLCARTFGSGDGGGMSGSGLRA